MSIKINITLLCLLTYSFIFAQPGKKTLKSIPNESYCVVSLNTSNIAEKIDFNRIKAIPVISTAFESLKKGAKKDSVLLKKFYQDPNSLGIALEPSITAFFHVNESESDGTASYVGVITPLSNVSKFNSLLKTILKEKYNDVKEGKNYSYIAQGDMVIAWNKKLLTFYSSLNHKGTHLLTTHLERVYKGDIKTSLIQNIEYNTFVNRENDFSVWIDVTKAEEILKDQFPQVADSLVISLQTSSIDLEMNFENGKIAFIMKQHHSEAIQDLINASYNKRMDVDLLKHITKDNLLGFAGMSFNTEVIRDMYNTKYQDLYDSIYNSISRKIIRDLVDKDSTLKVLRKSLYGQEALEQEDIEQEESLDKNQFTYNERDSIWNKIYAREDSIEQHYYQGKDSIISSVLSKYGLVKNDLWDLFTGDILLSSNGTYEVIDTFYTYEYVESQEGEWTYEEVEKTKKNALPLFKLLVGINYGESVKMALDDIMGLMDKNMSNVRVIKKKDYFIIDFNYTKIYISIIENKYILVTNNLDSHKESQNPENNLANSKEFDYLTKQTSSFLYMNLNAVLKESEKGDPDQLESLKILQETFSSFDAGSKGNNKEGYTNFANINLTKKDDNSIYILFDLLNEVYLYSQSFK
jgi:hypothetical protein